MRGLWGEVNTFFSYTSIHGFPYISDTQSRSTRKIWTIIVLVAFGVASNFLYQTIKGFDEKYVSTTIETQSIQKFPFPAITFHSGKYNSEKAFIRTFLNEFQFTRYNEGDVLRDNDEFGKLYKWLVSPMNNALLDDIEVFLIDKKHNTKKSFLENMGKMFKDEVCTLLAIHVDKKFKKKYRDITVKNMFKFRRFKQVRDFIKKDIGSIIQEEADIANVTKSDVTKACNNEKNTETKTTIEALLLSYMYIFIDIQNTYVGAGDLATGPYQTGLSRGNRNSATPVDYVPTHTLITNMYNVMVNGSLPPSVLQFPAFF